MRHKDGPQGTEEQAWSDQFDQDQIIQDGYPTQQATKPQTLSYAMMDSPVGIAAWILEKMHGWSDIKHNNIESEYTKDQLLTNIMVYIVTRTFNTASWIHYGRREEGGRILSKANELKYPQAVLYFQKNCWPGHHAAMQSASITNTPSGQKCQEADTSLPWKSMIC